MSNEFKQISALEECKQALRDYKVIARIKLKNYSKKDDINSGSIIIIY
jgi:hypothetical protein